MCLGQKVSTIVEFHPQHRISLSGSGARTRRDDDLGEDKGDHRCRHLTSRDQDHVRTHTQSVFMRSRGIRAVLVTVAVRPWSYDRSTDVEALYRYRSSLHKQTQLRVLTIDSYTDSGSSVSPCPPSRGTSHAPHHPPRPLHRNVKSSPPPRPPLQQVPPQHQPCPSPLLQDGRRINHHRPPRPPLSHPRDRVICP